LRDGGGLGEFEIANWAAVPRVNPYPGLSRLNRCHLMGRALAILGGLRYHTVYGMMPAAQKGNLAVQRVLHVALQNLITKICFCIINEKHTRRFKGLVGLITSHSHLMRYKYGRYK